MEVILMSDVKDLGQEGDVVTVADGYARNGLFPNKLAQPVTEATRRRLAKMREKREADRKAGIEKAREMAARLEGVSCTITAKVSEGEKMYGSVTAGDISAALAEQGVKLDKESIVLDEPLKQLGVFDVKVELSPDVSSFVKVWIVEE